MKFIGLLKFLTNFNMKHICTLSDKNYLLQGLSLYESLNKYSSDFTLHYLCIDDLSFNKLNTLNLPNLIPHSIKNLLNSDDELNQLFYGDYRYFCWSLASYFTNKLLSEYDSILYCDSDIYFYDNIETLYDKFGNKDVGIFRHRQFQYHENRSEGAYNVGVVYFKNTKKGNEISFWWKDAVINKKYPELSTCGDQKYLDNFQKMCDEAEIFIDGDIGHGAPWQWQLYDYREFIETGNIIWGGETQKLIFSHFSQFSPNFQNNTYIPSKIHHIYTPLKMYDDVPSLKMIYQDYFETIKKQKNIVDGC